MGIPLVAFKQFNLVVFSNPGGKQASVAEPLDPKPHTNLFGRSLADETSLVNPYSRLMWVQICICTVLVAPPMLGSSVFVWFAVSEPMYSFDVCHVDICCT